MIGGTYGGVAFPPGAPPTLGQFRSSCCCPHSRPHCAYHFSYGLSPGGYIVPVSNGGGGGMFIGVGGPIGVGVGVIGGTPIVEDDGAPRCCGGHDVCGISGDDIA